MQVLIILESTVMWRWRHAAGGLWSPGMGGEDQGYWPFTLEWPWVLACLLPSNAVS